jgi:DeoR/GlpR family transcriptional regulator of sugar metabolism
MLKVERQIRVLEMLRVEGKLVATDLSEALGVSKDTLRRDLRELTPSARGLPGSGVLRVLGG